LQAKLLRVLQEQEIEPLGSNRVLHLDVRVIAATSLDLAARVGAGQFRADLYYRLNVLGLSVPPLRERFSDLPLLTERLLDDISLRLGYPLELDEAAFAVLQAHAWPGNVRELKNVLERAVLMFESSRLSADNIAAVLPKTAALDSLENAARRGAATIQPLALAVAEAERSAILCALRAAKGNKVAASQALGISRAALYQKLETLGLRDAATDPVGAALRQAQDRPSSPR